MLVSEHFFHVCCAIIVEELKYGRIHTPTFFLFTGNQFICLNWNDNDVGSICQLRTKPCALNLGSFLVKLEHVPSGASRKVRWIEGIAQKMMVT